MWTLGPLRALLVLLACLLRPADPPTPDPPASAPVLPTHAELQLTCPERESLSRCDARERLGELALQFVSMNQEESRHDALFPLICPEDRVWPGSAVCGNFYSDFPPPGPPPVFALRSTLLSDDEREGSAVLVRPFTDDDGSVRTLEEDVHLRREGPGWCVQTGWGVDARRTRRAETIHRQNASAMVSLSQGDIPAAEAALLAGARALAALDPGRPPAGEFYEMEQALAEARRTWRGQAR